MAEYKGRASLGLMLLLGLALANVLISAQLIGQKGIVKTIQAENGDVIDCIDIDRQPALDHPLLKGHIVQTSPGSYVKAPKGNKEQNYTRKQSFFDTLARGEGCSDGSVPILRTTREQMDQRPPKASPLGRPHNVDVNLSKYNTRNDVTNFTGYEYAVVSANYGNYYGAQASLSVWHPRTTPGDHSLAEIWLISGGYNGVPRNTIEAGWLVDPDFSRETRLFTYWTADNYQHTGCYNLDCPGFVQVNQKMFPGVPLRPISVYGRAQDEIDISISKDNVTGYWWLRVDGADVGYWPSNLFSNTLRDYAELVMWGGEVYSSAPPAPGGRHITTQMGSGHFANESYGRSSYFRNVLPVTRPETSPNNISLLEIVTTPTYFNLQQGRNETGIYFYFGGPGYPQSGSAHTNKLGGIWVSIQLLATIVLGLLILYPW